MTCIRASQIEQTTGNSTKQGAVAGTGQGLSIGISIAKKEMHKRKISFDPRYLANASPSKIMNLKESLIENP